MSKKGTPFLPAIALLLAALPVLTWAARRMQDGGGELLSLVPLAGAIVLTVRDRHLLQPDPRQRTIAIALLLVYGLTFPFLPNLVRALLIVLVVAFVSGIAKLPGLLCLFILALPWAASLDFFLGYPLRLITSINAEFLLNATGVNVSREGVQLLHQGTVVGVDPACSGLNTLWSSALLTALLGAIFSLRWRPMIPLGLAALSLAILGNSLRAALLFFPESGLITIPHFLHPVIGLAIAGLVFLLLVCLTRRLSNHQIKQPLPSPAPPRQPLLLTATALFAAVVPLFSQPAAPLQTEAMAPLTHYRGHPVTAVALNPAERNFYRSFPGSIAVYQGHDFKLILREVNRATRLLHPASHCLRAEGFEIGSASLITDDDSQWLTYVITKDGSKWQVRERIYHPTTDTQWTAISAWYWHAFLHPNEGPWRTETTITWMGATH